MAEPATPRPTIRLDKWLWHARFFKTRSLATREVQAGHVRLNGTRVVKPAVSVGQGDVLTFAQGDLIRVVRLLAPGQRRGPASEAQALYDDLSPPPLPGAAPPAPTTAPGFDGNRYGGGRPSKKDRRTLDRVQGQILGQGGDSTA